MCTYRQYWLMSIDSPLQHLKRMASTLRGVAVGTLSATDEELRASLCSDQHTDQANARWAEADWFFGGYSVILSSFIETVMTEVLKAAGADLDQSYRWANLRKAFEKVGCCRLDQVAHYEEVVQVRELANSFKHNNFQVSPKLAEVSDHKEGERLGFLLEPWDTLVDATESFLKDLLDTLPGLESPMPITVKH